MTHGLEWHLFSFWRWISKIMRVFFNNAFLLFLWTDIWLLKLLEVFFLLRRLCGLTKVLHEFLLCYHFLSWLLSDFFSPTFNVIDKNVLYLFANNNNNKNQSKPKITTKNYKDTKCLFVYIYFFVHWVLSFWGFSLSKHFFLTWVQDVESILHV